MNIINLVSRHLKSTCDVENDKRCPMGGIDGCILLGNVLLVIVLALDCEINTHALATVKLQ